MAVKTIFNCDICDTEFTQRKGPNPEDINPIGGMNGFYEKDVLGDDKVMKKHLLQYTFDFCIDCNKKMIEYYFKLGGK